MRIKFKYGISIFAKFSLTLICILLSLPKVYAILPDTIAMRLAYQVWSYPQEKIYIATDRNLYYAGDTIRLRAFLLDATSLTSKEDGSKYIYVDLINPFGQSVKRIKILQNNGIFAGYIPLAENMAEGSYTIGSYTYYMQNQGEGYFFKKNIPIKSLMSKKYKLSTDFSSNLLQTSLKNRINGNNISANDVEIIDSSGDVIESIHNRSSKGFRINKKQLESGVVKIKYDKYEKYVNLPTDTSEFSITFHPEGGYLIPNVENTVGFKCIDTKGSGLDMDGYVVNLNGDIVANFKSSHLGIGSFKFKPEVGQNYKAIVKNLAFTLPLVNDQATTLTVKESGNDSIMVKMLGNVRDPMVLFGHNCGIPRYASIIDAAPKVIARNELGGGLVQLLLIDNFGNTISSRMIFNDYGYLQLDTINPLPQGDYAVSINQYSKPSDRSTSIVSELMLQSELKGYVEAPNYYFNRNETNRLKNLDNLLLTQGWERYDIPSTLKGNFVTPIKEIEIGGTLSGIVKSRFRGKPLSEAAVNVVSPEIGFIQVATTDSIGKFIIDGVDWPDGTTFAFRVFNKNGNPEHNFEIDKDTFPHIIPVSEDYISEENDDYKYSNDAIWLDELDVVSRLSDEELQRSMFTSLGVNMISEKDISDNNLTSYNEVIEKIPGLRLENGNVIHLPSKANLNNPNSGVVEIWIDGVQWNGGSTSEHEVVGSFKSLQATRSGGVVMPKGLNSFGLHASNTFSEFASTFPIEMIKEIRYYKPSLSLVISQTAAHNAGALVLTSKDGSSKLVNNDIFVKQVKPKGYQKPAECYQPHFTYDEFEDPLTIKTAWYPSVAELTHLPKMEINNILIEGITVRGIPVRIYCDTKELTKIDEIDANNTNKKDSEQ